MKKVRVTGVQILTPSMSFLTTFLNFSKLILSLKAQVCNISKNYIDTKFFYLTTKIFKIIPFTNVFLHKFDILINKPNIVAPIYWCYLCWQLQYIGATCAGSANMRRHADILQLYKFSRIF